MKLICKLFGHRWKYYLNSSNSFMQMTNIRVCKRCMLAQQWYTLSAWPNGITLLWMNMLQRTKKGAKELLEELKFKEIPNRVKKVHHKGTLY